VLSSLEYGLILPKIQITSPYPKVRARLPCEDKAKGLRFSIAGAVIFLASLVFLAFVSPAVALGLLAGGFMVWGGLLWTLFGFYSGPDASSG
jgi:hypothetical protein